MNDLVSLIDSNRAEISRRLPSYMNELQFFNLCYSIKRNRKLAEIALRNPDSMISAILKAADCGLLPGTAYDHCGFIPYKDEIQFQIYYQGLVYQLVRAGAIIKLVPHVVYEGDDFKIRYGDEEKLIHEPNLADQNRRSAQWLFDKRNMTGAYAMAWLPLPNAPGAIATVHRWCPLGEIEAARAKSKVPDGPAWTNNYPAMAEKTAVRRTCKLISVCGPTDENKEAWDRYGKTIDLERSDYRRDPDDNAVEEPDDLPGIRPVKQLDKPAPRVSVRVAGSRDTEHGTPPPQDDGSRRKQRVDAPVPTSPPAKSAETPISLETQNELMEMANAASIKTTTVLEFVRTKFGITDLGMTPSQASELKKFIKQQGMGAE